MQEWYLGRQKVSLLERCPQFRGVLIEGFHCIYKVDTDSLVLYIYIHIVILWDAAYTVEPL